MKRRDQSTTVRETQLVNQFLKNKDSIVTCPSECKIKCIMETSLVIKIEKTW